MDVNANRSQPQLELELELALSLAKIHMFSNYGKFYYVLNETIEILHNKLFLNCFLSKMSHEDNSSVELSDTNGEDKRI